MHTVILNNCIKNSFLRLCVFDNTPKDILRYPYIASMECAPQTLSLCCKAIKNKQCSSHYPLLYSSSSCFFALLQLDKNTNVMIGPVNSMPMTYREFYSTIQNDYIPEDLIHLYRIMQQSPRISLTQFVSNLSLLIQLLFGESISIEELLANHVCFPNTDLPHTHNDVNEPHYMSINESINFQKKILKMIQNGNINDVETAFQQTSLFATLEMSPSSAEDLMKLFFVYATLCCVATLEAGLDLQKAFPIFDTYVAKTTAITSLENLSELCRQISIDYCKQMIPLARAQSDSPVVMKCLKYIQDNICSKITITDLAQHCNLSNRTITRHFSEYHPIPVSECIMHYKLEEAAFLLRHSVFSLSEISNYLAFSSQSHFTFAFKKKYSLSPQKYRDKFRKTNSSYSSI